MAWDRHTAYEAMIWLRFMVRGTGVLCMLIIGCVMVWFTLRFSWQLIDLLERTLFDGPWFG